MTRKELEQIVRRIRYKPGWTFRVDDSGDVVITARVRDAYRRNRYKVRVRAYAIYHPQNTEQSLLGNIMEAIEALEFHEAREWFKYKGRRLFDPHAD